MGAPGLPSPRSGCSSPQPFPRHDGLSRSSSCAWEADVCVWWGFSWRPVRSEAPSLILWLTFTRLQHCTVQQLRWDQGTSLPPIAGEAAGTLQCGREANSTGHSCCHISKLAPIKLCCSPCNPYLLTIIN